MASIHLPNTISNQEKDVWTRIVAKRIKECQRMDEKDVEKLLDAPISGDLGKIPSSIKRATEKCKWALATLLYKAVDDKLIPSKRRAAYVNLKILLKRIDKAMQNLPPLPPPPREIHPSNTEIETSISVPQNTGGQFSIRNKAKPTPVQVRGNPVVAEPRKNGGTPDVNPTRAKPRHISAGSNISNPKNRFVLPIDAIQKNSSARVRASVGNATPSNPSSASHPSSQNIPRSTANANPRASSGVAAASSNRSLSNGASTSKTSEPLGQNKSTWENSGQGASNKTSGLGSKQSLTSSNTASSSKAWGKSAKSTASPLSKTLVAPQQPSRVVINQGQQKPNSSARQTAPTTQSSSGLTARKPQPTTPKPQPSSAPPKAITTEPVAVPGPVPSSAAVSSAKMGSAASALLVAGASSPSPVKKQSALEPLKQPQKVQTRRTQPRKSRSPVVLPPIPLPPQPREMKAHYKWISEATSKYTGALEPRPNSKVIWKGGILSDDEIMTTMRRFYIWDPYWEMLDVRALSKTMPIERVEQIEKKNAAAAKPCRAAEVSFPVPLNYQKQITGWNKTKYGDSYKHGEVRLLLRMIPGKVPQKPEKKSTKKKKLRSDYHLWPKGTFSQVDGKAIEISQRKQQAHDHAEWKGLCRFLDVTQHANTPETITLNVLTQDDELFYLCAAVCKFRAPDKLYQTLMSDNSIEKLTIQESIQLALEYAEDNMVCLVDDDVVHDESAASSFLFKLSCAISSSLMKTPVRARQCKHFQCFDLLNFLQSNVFVSGTRWECPVCNDEVINVYDLQHCALTQKMLTQYKADASTFRDRVEFFSDGTWKLMAEKRKRYSGVSNGAKKSKSSFPEPDIIIL